MGQLFLNIHTETSHYFTLAKIESNQIHSCKQSQESSYLLFSACTVEASSSGRETTWKNGCHRQLTVSATVTISYIIFLSICPLFFCSFSYCHCFNQVLIFVFSLRPLQELLTVFLAFDLVSLPNCCLSA